MSIDPTDPRSPSRQIADELRAQIVSGALEPGAALPSESVLVETYGTSPTTARQAVRLLKEEGLVVSERGRGVFVRKHPPTIHMGSHRFSRKTRAEGKAAFEAEIEAQGRRWGQEILELADVPAPKWVAEWFGIEPETTVFVRRRRNWVDDDPTQIADSYYRLETVADTAIRTEDTGPGGSYARLEEKGLRLERFREEISIRMPSPDETKSLRLPPGIPVAELRRIAFTSDGPVEVLTSVVAGDRHVFCYEFPAPE
ncbi:GntR family transcriptional regulator [Yinghuangia sp. ASG 101]|uniref:GntR family transcriptional regulator n=1 Tax=Yinghuangia sp. ASG 101 TaxID=2896848 RepID=UPI001E30CAEC|nr:GntR family transcriptional regulator [Yinghuangia sp. ASG 101]UGQ10025.1 GntR family transcriptional regulator [Yinghuangia sp. ASG 101]